MATLTLRNIPDDLLDQLKHLATQERRSMNAEAIVLLEQGVQQSGLLHQRLQALQRISARREQLPPTETESTTLLREDRAR